MAVKISEVRVFIIPHLVYYPIILGSWKFCNCS